MSRAYVIGLTGPTGAGKSTVSQIFCARGVAVIDADRVAREVLAGGSECLVELVLQFGHGILRADGSLDRAKLADIVFTDKEQLRRLNAITHPFIMGRIEQLLEEHGRAGADFIVLDAPTLFETGADRYCDTVVTVTAPEEVRLERIMQRDGLSEVRARNRMHAQHPDDFYAERSDFVLINDSEHGDLEMEVDGILAVLHRAQAGDIR